MSDLSKYEIVSDFEILKILEETYIVKNGPEGYDTRPRTPDGYGLDDAPEGYVLEGLALPVRTLHKYGGREEITESPCEPVQVMGDYPEFIRPLYIQDCFIGEEMYIRHREGQWRKYESTTGFGAHRLS